LLRCKRTLDNGAVGGGDSREVPKNGRAAFQNVDKHVQPVTRPILCIPGVYSRDEGGEGEREQERGGGRNREKERAANSMGWRVEIKKSDTDCTLSINRIDFPLQIQRAPRTT